MKVAACLTVLALTAVSVNPTVIHVPADQPTIQAGIDAAVNSDTVLVAAGDYPEHLVFASVSLVLLSSEGDSVTFI